MEQKEKEKKVKELCEKLSILLEKAIQEGYTHLQQIENRKIQREGFKIK